MSEAYEALLARKRHMPAGLGFEPVFLPSTLYPFQRVLVEWALRLGRAALFEDCGLGKTPQQLVWAENVVRKENGRVLVLAPLAVSPQTVREGTKFGVSVSRVRDQGGVSGPGVYVTNYERLHLFDSAAFVGVVCDESSILKNFDGATRSLVTAFLRGVKYRLLCTATAAPNDYLELGTSSEALGALGHIDMLNRFFVNEQNNSYSKSRYFKKENKWRFRGHAEEPFWRWVCSWARALRRPSDLGFEDGPFVLPPLEQKEHIVAVESRRPDLLFDMPAEDLHAQRAERRRSIRERCEKVAELVDDGEQALVWCHLNPEGDTLERLIPGAAQVSGADADEEKEERLLAFADGQVRVLVTKPQIGCFGLNLQRCAHTTFFPSHSWEQFYQGVRRCYRFGQARKVRVDVVTTEGERGVLQNLARKAEAADRMFSRLVSFMQCGLAAETRDGYVEKEEVPSWL